MIEQMQIAIIEENGYVNGYLESNEDDSKPILMGSIGAQLVIENGELNTAFTELMLDCAKHIIIETAKGKASIIGAFSLSKPPH